MKILKTTNSAASPGRLPWINSHAGIDWWALAAVLLLCLLAEARARAQEADTAGTRSVRIEQADQLSGSTEDNEPVQQLVGDVRLRQGPTQLRADRATRYTAQKEIFFQGNVRIVERGDSLFADRVRYDTQRKVGRGTGHVRLSDGEVTVYAPSGTYFTDEKRARFDEGLRLVDSLTVVTSEAGQYFSNEKRADFYRDVVMEKPDTRLTADSVTYYRETEVARGRGHVFIERKGDRETANADTVGARTFIYGGRVYNDDQAGYSRVTERPLLVQLRSDSARTDTLLIRAVQLEAFRRDSLRRLIAVDSVRIWKQNLAAVADSAVYDRVIGAGDSTRNETRLFRDPMAWSNETQISGDTIRVLGYNRAIDSLFAHRNAFVARRDTLINRIQQLQGGSLLGLFNKQNDLRQLGVGPNAETIYYRTNDQKQRDGAVQASGDSIAFAFRDGALHTIRALTGVQGTQYSENLLPSPFRLSGYRWAPGTRPTKARLLKALPVGRALPTEQPADSTTTDPLVDSVTQPPGPQSLRGDP